MAADDELPRGLSIAGPAVSGAPNSLTLPAIPGIAWVLTEFDIQLLDNGIAAAYHFNVFVTVGASNSQYGWMGDNAPGLGKTDVFSWSGELIAPVNTLIEVIVDAVPANCHTVIQAEAYPV